MSDEKEHKPTKVGIQVVTASGNYPEEGFREYSPSEPLSAVLEQARAHLKLQGTEHWIAKLSGRPLNADLSLSDNGITGNVMIMWAQDESGGGFSEDLHAPEGK